MRNEKMPQGIIWMAQRLNAIHLLRRRTGFGNSAALHGRRNVLRRSKPKARSRYFA